MTQTARLKVYRALSRMGDNYHFSPLEEGPNGKVIPKDSVFLALSYFLNRNHLLVGEPGWGKTTSAKILAALFSGLPYDLFDSLEIRGNPHKYEEKITGRYHFGKLNKEGVESVIWQGCFGLPVLVVDEGNRLSDDAQDVILQGIDTGRWVYNNASLYEGKKPTFITTNEKPGADQNGFIPALRDRFDIVTELGYWTTQAIKPKYLREAKRAVERDLVKTDYTTPAIDSLLRSFDAFKKALGERPIEGALTQDDLDQIRAEIEAVETAGNDNEPLLFVQAFTAEVNFSRKYGRKRASDPISDDTHDQAYAGVCVQNTFSPRSIMAAEEYAKALAWFLGEPYKLDHVLYVLPHVFATRAVFTNDYRNKFGNVDRKQGEHEPLDLSRRLVEEVYERYKKCIQPMRNWIAILDAWYGGEESRKGITPANDSEKELLRDLQKIEKGTLRAKDAPSLQEDKHDHPFMIDTVRQIKMPEAPFWESQEE